MRIVGWTDWDNPNYMERFKIGHTYDQQELEEADECVVNELRKQGYRFSGTYHQNGDFGVPVFDDGTVFQCSQRYWGGLMARAYPEEIDNSDGLGYVDWAWTIPEGKMQIVPKEGV